MASSFARFGVKPALSTPIFGVKRKRMSSLPFNHSGTDTSTPLIAYQNPSKRCRRDADEYNAKYMAGMAYSAYTTRRHSESRPKHTNRQSQAFQRALVDILDGLQLGSITEGDQRLRVIIPQLAHTVPSGGKSSVKLTGDFIAVYHCTRGNLDALDNLMDTNCKVDNIVLENLHELIRGLHQNLATASKWRDVLPYSPLSLRSLRFWRGRLQYSEAYRLLTHLVDDIDDIEAWLSFTPPRLSFPDNLKQVAMVAMEEQYERQMQALLEVDRADGIRKHLKSLRRELSAKAEREAARVLAKQKLQALRLAEEQEERSKKQDEQRTREQTEQRSREHAGAMKANVEAQRLQEAAAEMKRAEEEAQKQEERCLRDRQVQQAKAAELEQQRLARQREEEERKRSEALAAADAEREQLRARRDANKTLLQQLSQLLQRGNISQIELSGRNLPTHKQCHDALIQLWFEKGEFLENFVSEQLRSNPDLVLDLDFVLTDAQITLILLKLYKSDPGDIVNTGWEPDAMVRLQCELTSYAQEPSLLVLKSNVDSVCKMLQDAHREAKAEALAYLNAPVPSQRPLGPFLGGSNMGLNTNQNVRPQGQRTHHRTSPMLGVHKVNPLLDPNRTQLGENGLPISNPNPRFLAQYGHAHLPTSHHQQTHNNNFPQGTQAPSYPPTPANPSLPQSPTPRIKEACRFFKRGHCTNGDACTRPHAPCSFFVRGTCRYPDTCKGSHDPWFLNGGEGHMSDDSAPSMGGYAPASGFGESSLVDPDLAGRIAAGRARIPCKDGVECMRKRCAFRHDELRICDLEGY